METDQSEASRGGFQLKLVSLFAGGFKRLNFKQPITFPEGVVLITGLNESGKSTILDAVLYALYGRIIKSSSGSSDEEIIGYGCEDAQVRLRFSVAETLYEVEREAHRKSASSARLFELKPDGTRTAIATTDVDTNREIQRLLGGITFGEIVASTVVAQKDLQHLVNQRIEDRKQVINVFLNLDSLNRVRDRIEEERISLEGTSNNPGLLPLERRTLQTLEQQMGNYKDKEAQLSALARKIDIFKQELEKSSRELEKTSRLRQNLQQHREALHLSKEIEAKAELENSLDSQLANLSTFKSELEHIKTQEKEYADLASVEKVISQASTDLEKVRELEIVHSQLFDQARQLQASIGAAEKSQGGQLISRLNALKNRPWTFLLRATALWTGAALLFFLNFPILAALVALGAAAFLVLFVRELKTWKNVPHKGEVGESSRVPVRVLERDLEKLKQTIFEENRRIIEQSGGVLTALRSIFPDSTSIAGLDEPRRLLEYAKGLLDRHKQSLLLLDGRAKKLETQVQEENHVQRRLRETRNELMVLKQKLEDLQPSFLPEEKVFSEEALEQAERQMDSLKIVISRVEAQIEESIARWLEINTFIEEHKNGIEEKLDAQKRMVQLLENELAVVQYSAMGLEQTSATLRTRVNPRVAHYIGRILPVITSGRYRAVKMDDNYATSVFDPEAGEFRPKEIFSGGTEDQLMLAMRLAFALALTPKSKEKSPEFLFLDEPLESSDKERQEATLGLLQNELSKDFRQIFVISHVRDLDIAPNATIQMDNGMATEIINHQARTTEALVTAA